MGHDDNNTSTTPSRTLKEGKEARTHYDKRGNPVYGKKGKSGRTIFGKEQQTEERRREEQLQRRRTGQTTQREIPGGQ